LAVKPPLGCFYWTAKGRSSRRLAIISRAFLRERRAERLSSTSLLLAPPQVFAQRLGQALLARCAFGVPFSAGLRRFGHQAMQAVGAGTVKQ